MKVGLYAQDKEVVIQALRSSKKGSGTKEECKKKTKGSKRKSKKRKVNKEAPGESSFEP